jgi:hypothetical protein
LAQPFTFHFNGLGAPRSDMDRHKTPQNDTFSSRLLHTHSSIADGECCSFPRGRQILLLMPILAASSHRLQAESRQIAGCGQIFLTQSGRFVSRSAGHISTSARQALGSAIVPCTAGLGRRLRRSALVALTSRTTVDLAFGLVVRLWRSTASSSRRSASSECLYDFLNAIPSGRRSGPASPLHWIMPRAPLDASVCMGTKHLV